MLKRKQVKLLAVLLFCSVLLSICILISHNKAPQSFTIGDIPDFSGYAYVVINNNQPAFSENELTAESYEFYSDLDYLGRCGYAMACIGVELMPTEERDSISQVKPTGWAQLQYAFIDGKNLYNRCHLIGFQLAGENANEKNLITGTRYMNVEGMLPFENMIADYVQKTNNHVMYRVTPIFIGNNLVASGVQMEALSVEDNGEGISFHIYAYNNQPGVEINYADGTSREIGGNIQPSYSTNEIKEIIYILNISSKKFHLKSCPQGSAILESNREEYTGDRQAILNRGFVPAGCCNP